MAAGIRGAAESAKNRLRDSLRELSSNLAAQDRNYRSLDTNVYMLYALECFLQALASSERGADFVLKGGNLFRVWDHMGSFRPTGDLDMQCKDEAADFEDVRDLRQELARVVDSDLFRDTTGLVFPLEDFRLEPIRKGSLVAYRLEGKAILGEPHVLGPRPAEIPFCLEVTYGAPPPGATETSQWQSVMGRGGSFDLQTSKPEWMASEKFHSVVTRGISNSRLKDYRDLAILLRLPTFDEALMQRCVQQVFAELGQSHLVPRTATGLTGLSPAFATSQNEYLWQRKRWPEWEGRDWDASKDPSLAETVSAIVLGLEHRGVLDETRGCKAATILGEFCRLAAELEVAGPKPVTSGRFATALKALAPALEHAAPAEVGLRWLGAARTAGLAGKSAVEAFDRALDTAAELGLMAAIDRGWDRGRGGGRAAVQAMRNALVLAKPALAAPASPVAAATPAAPQLPRAAAPVARPAVRRPRLAAARKDPDSIMADGIHMLEASRPGTHVWFGGLAKVLASVGAAVPDAGGMALEMPEDTRAPYIWIHVAKKQGVEPDLDRAVGMAREILGMEQMAPGPGM